MKSDHRPENLHRVAVIGTSSSGKTVFAGRLAQLLGVPHIEMDELNWLPGWEMRPLDEFRDLVAQAASGEKWVIDGNYGKVRDLIWGRATHLVWLNYSFPVVFFRALRRTFLRVITREELYSGNRETLWQAIFDREAIPWWVIRTYGRRRREYPRLFAQQSYGQLEMIELRSPREADSWLEGLAGDTLESC